MKYKSVYLGQNLKTSLSRHQSHTKFGLQKKMVLGLKQISESIASLTRKEDSPQVKNISSRFRAVMFSSMEKSLNH